MKGCAANEYNANPLISASQGLSSLGNITVSKFIAGSADTYITNSDTDGAFVADLVGQQTL